MRMGMGMVMLVLLLWLMMLRIRVVWRIRRRSGEPYVGEALIERRIFRRNTRRRSGGRRGYGQLLDRTKGGRCSRRRGFVLFAKQRHGEWWDGRDDRPKRTKRRRGRRGEGR
jgi:hypothetical protein